MNSNSKKFFHKGFYNQKKTRTISSVRVKPKSYICENAMIVDDDLSFARSFKRQLADSVNQNIYLHNSVIEAIKDLNNREKIKSGDLILTDKDMPNMNGLIFSKSIYSLRHSIQSETHKKVGLILITGSYLSEQDKINQYKQEGIIDDFIIKSADSPQQIEHKIRKVIQSTLK